jgi:hypothetical protein
VGRQTNISNVDLAYIAGFLDGDGSIIVQIKNRKDTSRGWRIMFTICFYQDTRHEKSLFWIRKKLGIGYVSRRKDGITELRINGYQRTEDVLSKIYPYARFKRKQIRYILEILDILKREKKIFRLTKKEREKIASLILNARNETYQSGLKSRLKLEKDLDKITNI